MPRICNREGCGRRIVARDGSTDYRKHFCGPACLKIDKRERLQAKRLRLENCRCSHCGRKPMPAVSRQLAAPSDESKRHRGGLCEASAPANGRISGASRSGGLEMAVE